MLLKFVLKNLILVALIAFAINWIIVKNIQMLSSKPSIPQNQFEELTGGVIFYESQLEQETQKDPS
jgi:hypothetical protein